MKKIIQISVLGASECDLSCSYCYLGKNCEFKNQDAVILKAWQDGSYLNNVAKVLEVYNSDPKEVASFQLWGGEPTLHIEEIQKSGGGTQIGKLFPNLRDFLIPTNFNSTNIKALIDFIYDIDKELSDRIPGERIDSLNFHVQASIDGPPGDFNTYGHKVSWETYMKNYNELFDYLKEKNVKLKNTSLHINICPCSSQHLILKNLNTYEKIKEFRKFYDDFVNYMQNRANEVVDIADVVVMTGGFYPRIAISQATTSEEAMEIEKIIRLFDICEYQEKSNNIEKTDNSNYYHDCSAVTAYNNRNHECVESNEYSITLMPDGTIAQCPCLFFQDLPGFREDYLKNKDYWNYKSTLIRSSCFYNPLNNKDGRKIRDHEWYVRGGGYLGTHSTYINLNFNMAREMALSHQIDFNYAFDEELLLDHYLAYFMATECYRENVECYHNLYIADVNQFRRWFNGSTELSYNSFKNAVKFSFDWEAKKIDD